MSNNNVITCDENGVRQERRHVPLIWLKLNPLLFPYCITITWVLWGEAVFGLLSVRKSLPVSRRSTKWIQKVCLENTGDFNPQWRSTLVKISTITEISYPDFTHLLHKYILRAICAREHAKHVYNSESILDTTLNGQTRIFCKILFWWSVLAHLSSFMLKLMSKRRNHNPCFPYHLQVPTNPRV